MAYKTGSFVWFELVTDDVPAATRFYSETLGWSAADAGMSGMDYTFLATKTGERAGMTTPQQKGVPNHWISYVSVADVDKCAGRVETAGGKVVVPATDIPGVGRFALVADPQGGMLNVLRANDGDNPNSEFHWNELWPRDAEAVLPFYEKVLGYTAEPMDMPTGKYYVFKTNGEAVGGCMTPPAKLPSAAWVPYIKVDNVDSAANRAQAQGGTLQGELMEVEGVGRFAIVADATGATVGLIQPAD